MRNFPDPGFLRYYLVLQARKMSNYQFHFPGPTVSGGTRNALTKGMLELVGDTNSAPLAQNSKPSAHILGTLDDKIELNRRMNRTLEEMARAIFQDWFVDFGPTKAKMEGLDPYLFPELWGLFPDKLVDSETGGDTGGVGNQAIGRDHRIGLR